MVGWDSILHDIFGAALIIAVLTALAVVVKLLAAAVNASREKAQADEDSAQSAEAVIATESAQGELKLIRTDEKTAALIMAVISDESGIPLGELNFHSIKLID